MFRNDKTKKTITFVFTVYFVTHEEVQNQTQYPNLKQRKILFLNSSFAFRINVYGLLHGLKAIMKRDIMERKKYF